MKHSKTNRDPQPLSPDRALGDPAEDRLGYAPFAKHLAHGVLRGCPADGLVVGIYGAWGSGKSTLLNFVLHYLACDPDAEAPVVVHFNPWWFAGQDDLVRRFFRQFEASLFHAKARKRGLLKKVAAFGAAVEDLGVPYAGKAGKLVKEALEARECDVVGLKSELVAALAKEATRIVVVIDDVDRLGAEEVRQLFQVVKAIADFPNVIYMIAFDHDAVAAALDPTDPTRGAAYLEKIVQVPFSVPPPDRLQLQTLLFEKLERALTDTPQNLLDQQRWGNLYFDGINTLVERPRDVMRLSNALSVTYPAVLGEVDAVDFVGIESLRLFVPKAYEAIARNPEMFVGTGDEMGRGGGSRDSERAFHEEWLADIPSVRPILERLLSRLFPRLESVWGNNVYGHQSLAGWRRGLRVCSPDIFPTFFRLAVPTGEVSAALVREFLAGEATAERMAAQLATLAKEKRADGYTRASSLLQRLLDIAETGIDESTALLILRALFDVGDEVVREGRKTSSPLDLGDEYRVGWLIKALLRLMPVEKREGILSNAFAQGRGLVTMVRELRFLGRQHALWEGQRAEDSDLLVGLQTIEVLQRVLLKRIRSASADGSLWACVPTRPLLEAWKMFGEQKEMRQAVAAQISSDDALLDFLGWFGTAVQTSGLTDRVAKVTIRMDPNRLTDFVDVDVIAPRLEALRLRHDLTPEQKDRLSAFRDGLAARRAGADPMDPRHDD